MAMSDYLMVVLVLVGIVAVAVAAITIPHHYMQRKESREWRADFRALQLEIARENLASHRQLRRSHADVLAYMKTVGVRAEQIFERVDDR